MPVHLGSMGESIKMVIKRNRGDLQGADGAAAPRGTDRGIRRGDVYVLNDPYHGGTHLPDITVVTPVFAPPGSKKHEPTTPMLHRGGQDDTDAPSLSWDPGASDPQAPRAPRARPGPADGDAEDEIWFYVASRGHHGEIGGVSPGSMPASSTRVEEGARLADNCLPDHDARPTEAATLR